MLDRVLNTPMSVCSGDLLHKLVKEALSLTGREETNISRIVLSVSILCEIY